MFKKNKINSTQPKIFVQVTSRLVKDTLYIHVDVEVPTLRLYVMTKTVFVAVTTSLKKVRVISCQGALCVSFHKMTSQ